MAPCLKLGFNNADKVERKSELVIKQSAASQQFWIRQCGFPQWQPSPQTHLIIPTSTTHPIQSTHPIHPSHPTHPLVIISSILPCPTTCPLQARALYCQNVKHQINAYAMISLLAKQLFFWSRPDLFVFAKYFLTISYDQMEVTGAGPTDTSVWTTGITSSVSSANSEATVS